MTETVTPIAAGTPASGVAALPHLGVIRVRGEDAASFLQGQLTQDMVQMKPGEARLAALCNPKGRVRASFIACRRAADEFWLVCSHDLLAATLKRLSMFVLRAKARLDDATAEFALHGLVGEAAVSATASADAFIAPLPPADGVARALWIGAAGDALPAGPTLTAELWDWMAVRSGVATVTAPVADAFVPQMLNYESTDGVNFKKGCYPGQEVVARSQFRGAIKRRAYVARVDGAAQAGDDVFSAADPEQPVGQIVQAAAAPKGGTEVIVSLQTVAVQSGESLHVLSATGPALLAPHQPYALIEV
ncbi:MAG: folate-binding protein YgfZ [Burkholderiales bacterium]|nr:folate-binding protein YgfZ [Burkholderiales bacterium]MBK8665663.1 folate-binding protein YgfZ [Burkholderiales bacterium]